MTFFEWFYKVSVLSGILVAILVLTVTFTKLFIPKTYTEIKDFYTQNFTTDTNISEVIKGEI